MFMLYPDRKMMKWQGFFLSEHQEALHDDNRLAFSFELDEQTQEKIIGQLEVAWKNKTQLIIQTKERNMNGALYSIQGVVEGFSDNLVFVVASDKVHSIMVDMLHAVQPVDETKWFL